MVCNSIDSEQYQTVTLISKDDFAVLNGGRFLDVISSKGNGFHITKIKISNDPNTKIGQSFKGLRFNVPCKLMPSGIIEEVPVYLCEH